MINNKRIGLALSGGGYRATACHIGTFRKLRELGLLDKIDVISSVSGGSILASYYGLHKDDYEQFEKGALRGVSTSVIGYILRSWQFIILVLSIEASLFTVIYLCGGIAGTIGVILFWVILFEFFQFRLLPLHKLIPRAYDKIFFGNKKLSDLPSHPLIALNSTNLESGRQFTFSAIKMTDSFYEYPRDSKGEIKFSHRDFPLSKAVYASSCVPFIFSPVKIGKEYYVDPADFSRASPLLIDGGVYDNQGIHKLTQESSRYHCDYIIVSDAGNCELITGHPNNSIQLLAKTCNLFMTRIKNFQMSQTLYSKASKDKRIAYFSLKWDPADSVRAFIGSVYQGTVDPDVWRYHGITAEEIEKKMDTVIMEKLKKSIGFENLEKQFPDRKERKIIGRIGTNLTALTPRKTEILVRQSAVLTEIHLRLYCPDIICG